MLASLRISRPALLVLATLLAAAGACSETRNPTAPSTRRPIARPSMDESSDEPGAGTFTKFDVPGAFSTNALAIRDDGWVVGRYQRIKGETHGFLRSPTGEFTTINFPGANFSVTTDFNRRGDILGQYRLPTDPDNTLHGFVRTNGEFTSFDMPGASFTTALGINDRGDIVGRYCSGVQCAADAVGDGVFRAYLLRDGVFTPIDFPGAIETDAFKITARGLIFGSYLRSDMQGYLFTWRKGKFTTIDLPGVPLVSQNQGGINSRGDIVGIFCEAKPCDILNTKFHGFELIDGVFAQIDFPGSTTTALTGINAHGDIVGSYRDAHGRIHSFLLTSRNRDDHDDEKE